MRFKCFVDGLPATQGNHRVGRNGKIYEQSSKKLKTWRELVSVAAWGVRKGEDPFEGPVRVDLGFHLPRPKAHFNSKGELKADAPRVHVVRPDIDKLTRAVLDGVTGQFFNDDSQVVGLHVEKWWSDDGVTGCTVRVEEV
jgi:crossover junction endodeoxyribonuclease RusA